MLDFDGSPASYAILAVATMIPSLAFVKFVGDQADKSREDISSDSKKRFKKSMMEQPGSNLLVPSSQEEAIKRQIAKAYSQDKDVDVAVLEQKLKERAKWRKEVLTNQKSGSGDTFEDEDGW